MSIQSSKRFIFKRTGVLIFGLLASVSLLSAQSLIYKQPDSPIVKCLSDGYAILSLQATGTNMDGYLFQWQQWRGTGFINIQTAAMGPEYQVQLSSLSQPPVEERYRCIVRYGARSDTSRVVVLTVNDKPKIGGIDGIGGNEGFESLSLCDGGKLWANAIDILPMGSSLTNYTWSFNGEAKSSGSINNNIIPTFVSTNLSLEDSEKYLEIAVKNACGTATAQRMVHVWKTPPLPTPVVKEFYCQGETASPLSIIETNPVWYNGPTGTPRPDAPTPDTSTPGTTQSWWVSHQVKYHSEATCESNRREVSVKIYSVPGPPETKRDTVLCLNDPSYILKAQGTAIKWYDELKNALATSPQITTSKEGLQTYYVTQSNGNCESRKDEGKVTVRITNRSDTVKFNLPRIDLCPNNSVEITARAQVQDGKSTFKWYKNDNKTVLLHVGPTFTTPVLKNDTVYYVTVTYGGLCESSYPKAAVVNVKDSELPTIKAPPSLVINTDPGVCFAAGVDVGFPDISDNCTDIDKLIVFTDAYRPGVFPTYFSMGDTTLVWWVMDESGNRTRDLQTISVRDREKPKGKCPRDISVEINDNENSAIVYYELDYTDNCGKVTYTIDTLIYRNDPLRRKPVSGSVFPLGETRVRHFVSDKAGNVDTCEFKVIVKHPYRVMEVVLNVSKSKICPGEQVVITPLINGGSGKYSFSWKSPRYWTESEMRDYPLKNTIYEVIVSDGITEEKRSVEIIVLETRQVTLTLERYNNMDEIFEGDEVLITATPGFASYKLLLNNVVMQTSGLNNGISFQAELGNYVARVFATDFSDCVTQHELKIFVDSKKLPDVFTPNFDGKNDIFLEGFDLEVYSRAGQLLYKGFNGWDGTYKGKMMPQGTYLYVVRRVMNNGEPWIFRNTVTLKL